MNRTQVLYLMYSLDSWHYIPTEYRSPPNPLLELSAPYNRGLLWKTPRTVEDGLASNQYLGLKPLLTELHDPIRQVGGDVLALQAPIVVLKGGINAGEYLRHRHPWAASASCDLAVETASALFPKQGKVGRGQPPIPCHCLHSLSEAGSQR